MDPSAMSHPIVGRANSGNKNPPRQGEKSEEKTISLKASQSAHRGTRYKEKFQALREKYEQVTATHDSYERELAIADEKVKKLQEECNLLLDAVDIAAPAQPSLLHYLSRDPIPLQYHSYQYPLPPPPTAPPPPPSPPMMSRSRHRSVTHTNGNGVQRQ